MPETSIDQSMEPARVPNPAFEAQRDGDANRVTPREILIPQQGPPALPQGDVVGVQQNSVRWLMVLHLQLILRLLL